MYHTRLPHNFYKPLAIGAPAPWRERPLRAERMVHFFPPHLEKVRAKIPELVRQCDVLCGNLEDAIPVEDKAAARAGFIEVARTNDFSETGLWVRVNCLNSPWILDDLEQIVAQAGNIVDVLMIPKVEGPWDLHFVDQYVALLEARHGITRPIMLHALIETAEGVRNVDTIAGATPRLHGMSLGPADLAASRGMKTTRVGGGHPDYGVLGDPVPGDDAAPRAFVQQDLWHYSVARIVDACVAHGLRPFYGPFGDIRDEAGCEAQMRNVFVMGMVGAWSLAPNQVEIARRVFSPNVAEVRFARRVLEALPTGSGVAMIDGKMQDDATWKQAKVIVDLARLVARKDPALAEAYGFTDGG
ncbi:MAG: CoA ester lyase [Gemmatimonadetes bacterium]|nr:CoA ester lyase [Gemmatimonadota bacterium]